jgi:hypothetical protein
MGHPPSAVGWFTMATELIAEEIRRFLSSTEPEVICITGHWGVGKTFAWRHYLSEASSKKKIALPHYSYISLFGISSLEELRYSIFENSVESSAVEILPSIDTLKSNTTALTKKLGKQLFGILQAASFTKNYLGGIGPALFLSVKNTIICIDDVERMGTGVTIRDVLGLISLLKEQKGCKVVLILNDEALESEKEEFKRYFEKVVDSVLRFTPTSSECVQIALNNVGKTERFLAENCVKLGISNIRLIKKIERLVRRIEPILASYDDSVLMQAVHSIALLAWSLYDPDKAPSLDFIQRRQSDLLGIDKEKLTPLHASWNALLDAYGFSEVDEFDGVLLDGVKNGFFDMALVQSRAAQLDERAKSGKLQNSFFKAWEMFHSSFRDNQNEVLDAIYGSAIDIIRFITPINLSGTVSLLKELGRGEQANDLIRCYVSHRSARQDFDLRRYPFGEEVRDPDVIEAFEDKLSTFPSKRSPTTILDSMAEMNGWSPEDIIALSTLTADEYYDIFKKSTGHDLARRVSTCLQFDGIGNASTEMRAISKLAREALKRIGQESPMNERRVRRYGVVIEEPGASRELSL